MKKILLSSIFVVLFGITSCGGPNLKNTVLAAEAMQRAKEVQADIYAPKEYKIASKLFDQMNKELDEKKYEDANRTALLVIDAANNAIRAARQAKSMEK